MSETRDQLLFDLFTTAMEGGINYWSQCARYHWAEDANRGTEDKRGFFAVIREYDEETDLRIDRAVIARGYRLATTEWRDRIGWSSGEKPPPVITSDTYWDYDAGDADAVVQLGLFGEVVYG